MMKKYINKQNLKVVGDAGYRVGKDIVREGTKAVIGKAAGAALAVTLKEGFGGIKKIDLDTVLGDVSRIEKKKAKKLKKLEKKKAKKEDLGERLEEHFGSEMREKYEKVENKKEEVVDDLKDIEKKVTE